MVAVFGQPTATASTPVEFEHATSPRTPPASQGRARQAEWLRAKQGLQTGLEVDPAERGADDERNHAIGSEPNGDRPSQEPESADDGEASRLRSELARDLIRRVDELLPLAGSVSLATHISLLKRDLSRCHDALKNHANQSNYVSIITLVESALAQMKWKDYSSQKLDAIRQALEVGYRQVKVSFEDYEQARDLFSKGGVETTPLIDLEALPWQDITDAEEA